MAEYPIDLTQPPRGIKNVLEFASEPAASRDTIPGVGADRDGGGNQINNHASTWVPIPPNRGWEIHKFRLDFSYQMLNAQRLNLQPEEIRLICRDIMIPAFGPELKSGFTPLVKSDE